MFPFILDVGEVDASMFHGILAVKRPQGINEIYSTIYIDTFLIHFP